MDLVLVSVPAQVEDVEEATEQATSAWDTLVEGLPRIDIAIGVLTLLVVLGRFLRWVVRRRLAKHRTRSFASVFAPRHYPAPRQSSAVHVSHGNLIEGDTSSRNFAAGIYAIGPWPSAGLDEFNNTIRDNVTQPQRARRHPARRGRRPHDGGRQPWARKRLGQRAG